jgi:transcriptional regulator with PAS, ATPase and Fis domain
VRLGRFRSDLYFRLKVVGIMLPPLRDREGDVAMLSRHFMKEFSRKFQKGFTELAPDATRYLEAYPWPGNVRELRNLIERVVLLEEGERLEADHLPPEMLGRRSAPGPAAAAAMRDVLALPTLAQIEMEHINEVLRLTSGNKSRAARILGISRQGLIEKLRRLRIEETSEKVL